MSNDGPKHQEGIVGVFSRAAATYDRIGPRFFTHFGERLVELAQIAPGSDVLDVASGRGAVLFPAGERVGANGRVIGIDLSSEMVQETARDIQNAGCGNVQIRRMSAEELDFPEASFDRVFCGFAIWFFPQPQASLREFYRVLKPAGRVGLTTWSEDSPFLSWFRREMASILPPVETQTAGREEAPRFNTPERLEEALQQAGFQDIDVRTEEQDFVYTDEEEWWLSVWSHGLRERLETLEESVLTEVKSDLLQRVQALKQPDGIHTQFRALFGLGNKPVH